jgi:hypothetical protein
MIYDLSSFKNPTENNLGGLCRIYFVPREWLLKPVVLSIEDNSVQAAVELMPGKSWLTGEPLQGTAMFEEEQRRPEAGLMFAQRVTFQVMRDESYMSTVMNAFSRHEYVVTVRDNNGKMRLVGNEKKGMTPTYKTTTGTGVESKNHFAVELVHESEGPAPFTGFSPV